MTSEQDDGEIERFAELAELGVTVRDREEFEDGLMKQLDREAAKRNIEQQKKFTEKELVDVRKEINMVGVELSNLDKTIGALIKLPVTSIAAKLRNAKSQKELKEKQLQKLKARELSLTAKLQNNSFDDDLEQGDVGGSNDIAFGVSVAPGNKEMADLIQHGHMTPFGGQIIDGVSHDGKGIELSSNSTNPSDSTNPSNSTITKDSDEILCNDNSILENSNSQNTSEIHDKIEIHDEIGIHDNTGMATMAGVDGDTNDDMTDSDNDEAFVPGLNDNNIYYSTSDASYITDDDDSEIRGQSLKVKRYRDIHSSESDDDMIHTNKIKKVKGRTPSSRRRSHTLTVDDGDDQLYKMRIKEMEEANDDDRENFEDMKFNGGLLIPGKIWHRLYKYQRTGVQWLWELHGQQAGGIVGDEMGLGKTIQMIAFLAGLRVSKLYSNVTRCRGLGPVLIVCPATVLHQWVREFHTWWAPFRVVVMHNTGSFQGKKETLVSRMVKCNAVVITTYQGVRLYRNSLLRHQWDYVILDEGHKIRNPDADITLTCKQFTTPHKIILSGSPMQNNLKELWSLFDFVFPGKLGTLPVFLEQFSVPITMGGYSSATKIQVQTAYRCACVLRDTISPYLLRRLKADVKIQLPSKNEQVLFCQLTGIQREMYEDFLKSPEVSNILVGRKKVFSGIATLRKICNHPDLVGIKEKAQSCDNESPDLDRRSRDPERSCDQHGYWDRSGKMMVIVSLLKVWHSLGHRVLLFSQTRKMLDILEQLVRSSDYTYLRMDGTTSVGSRQHLINSFNQSSEIFVFLLTTRVGGLGVNLTGADRVVIYDPDWNPSTDTQARERAWRIGQSKQVTIYRLVTTGTIEEKIYHRQIFKQFLTNRILRDPRQRRLFKTNDLYDLFTLGSGDSPSNETSALFAGTGSEVKQLSKSKAKVSKEKSKKKLSNKSSSDVCKSSPHTSSLPSQSSCDPSSSQSSCDPNINLSFSKSSCDLSSSQISCDPSSSQSSCDPRSSSKSKHRLKSLEEIRKAWQVELFGDGSAQQECSHTPKTCNADQVHYKSRKRKHSRAFVDGAAIAGLERTAVFEEPGAEKENAKEENDSVLNMLMKKTGLHSVFHHETMVNGGDPDYILMESEAEHVAQGAARALLQSRLQCHEESRWGLPTWTGQNGFAGRPSRLPRFGSTERSPVICSDASGTAHFGGDELQPSGEGVGSANMSSAILLQKIQQRNAHKSGNGVVPDSSSVEQLREIRDFIACQCSKDGQATTAELIGRFSGTAHERNQSTFKSMLKEICEFYREHGTGVWRLKPEYRY